MQRDHRVSSLRRDRHQVRAGAEDSGKAVLDRSRSAYEVEQNLTLFARQEEGPAEGRNRGPLGIRYGAPSTFASGTPLTETISSHDLSVSNQPTEPFSSALRAACRTERSRSSL